MRESRGVTALPGAANLERLPFFSNLIDGCPYLRVGGAFAVEDGADGLHS